MTPNLSPDVCNAVAENHGYTEAEANGSKFVVMSIEFYREMFGIDDTELSESLQALAESRQDIAAGRTRPLGEVLDELGKHEV